MSLSATDQCRAGALAQHPIYSASQDHLDQRAMPIPTHHEQIDSLTLSNLQHNLGHRA